MGCFSKHPISALAPKSALGLLPSIALSSAQAVISLIPKPTDRTNSTRQINQKIDQLILHPSLDEIEMMSVPLTIHATNSSNSMKVSDLQNFCSTESPRFRLRTRKYLFNRNGKIQVCGKTNLFQLISITLERIPSLDGLRAVSIGLVLFAHLSGTRYFPLVADSLNLGNFGVRVFFIVSGFLITGILLREIDQTGGISLRRFYYRRTLRIFPPYYFFLLVLGIFSLFGIVSVTLPEWLSAVLYVSNFAPIQSWELGHTWSLAVEEQFYLLMPAILLIGKRKALIILCGVVVFSPFIRLATFMAFPDPNTRWVAMGFQANADSLATGCLMAFGYKYLAERADFKRFIRSNLICIFPIIALLLNTLADRPRVYFFACVSIINFCLGMFILWAVENSTSCVGRIFNTRPLLYIGTLSYSIYLWQQLFLNRESESSFFPLNLSAVVVFALISYYFVERPALAFRHRMEHKILRRLTAKKG